MRGYYLSAALGVALLFSVGLLLRERQHGRQLQLELTNVKNGPAASAASPKPSRPQQSSVPLSASSDLVRDAAEASRKQRAAEVYQNAVARLQRKRALQGTDIKEQKARREVARLYAGALASLGLRDDVEQSVKRLLTERLLSEWDAVEESKSARLSRDSRADLIEKLKSEMNEELSSLLGAEGYQRLDRALASSRYIDQIQNTHALDLAYDGVPLTAQQATDLASLMREASVSAGVANEPTGASDATSGLSARDVQVLDRASSILSKEQLESLRKSFSAAAKERMAVQALTP